MADYGVTYKNLGHSHPGISTVIDMGEYNPPKKGVFHPKNH